MSFKNANQALQRFIIDKYYAIPKYDSINAMLDARRFNTTILEGDVTKTGKKRQIKVSFYGIDCNSINNGARQTLCTSGTVQEPVQEWYDITRWVETKKKALLISDVRLVDGDFSFSDHAKALILAEMGAARKELATQIDTLLMSKAGLQLSGNATKRVTLTNGTTGVVQPVGLWDIEQDFADGGYTMPFVIGSREVFQWKKALAIGTPNSTTGQDPTKLSEANMYYDTLLNSVGGDTANGEHILAFDPQSLKFVSYNKNVGMFATDEATVDQLDKLYKAGPTDYMKGVFRDPVSGIMWDYFLNFDKCIGEEGGFTFHLSLEWDIFFTPVQSCNAQGVNGIFHYRTCPVKLAPCPSGDTPSPVVATRTFSWTPTLANIPTISQSVIGGQTDFQNQPVAIANIAALVAYMNDAYGSPGFFSASGGNVVYTGISAISGSFNNANYAFTFA